MYAYLAILALFVFAYGLFSGYLEKTVVSGPMLYVLFGLGLGVAGLGLEPINIKGEALKDLAELTLALVLFTDASNADLKALRKAYTLPRRLLAVGLPLTILLGFAFAALLFNGLSLIEAALLATMLAPTDAALGKAVVTNEAVPVEIRDGLNVESGLNDGICVPILFIFLALAVDESAHRHLLGLALEHVAEAVGIGLGVGVAVSCLGVLAIKACSGLGFIDKIWNQLLIAALAMGSFALAQVLQGSGFIAAFVGGLCFNHLAGRFKEELLPAAEGWGDALALVTWVVFGYVVILKVRDDLTWPILAYAVLSLTLVRMLPVYFALSGLGLSRGTKLFVGWFGPRGLASVVFAVLVYDADLPGGKTMVATVAATIILSILFHGLTANPLVRRLERWN